MGTPLVETLESRIFLSASATPAAASNDIAFLDRRELLSHFSGELHASLSKTLRHSGVAAFDASLLKYMTRRQGPFFTFNGRQLTRRFADANFRNSSLLASPVDSADDIVSYLFPEQPNSETFTVQLGKAIEWDAQPASTDNADFLHGLNRHAFWKDLALAYRQTGDGKYVRELVSQFTSWSEQTPALANPDDWQASSPHWWLLDAADRAANWTYTYLMVLGSPDWTPAANSLFLQKLWEHGDFLYRVTPSNFRSNKAAGHAAGLFEIGIEFPEFSEAAAWESKGATMTWRCMDAQFYPDGGHVEETPAYAVTAIGSFLSTFRLGNLNAKSYMTRKRRIALQNIVEAEFELLTPDFKLPAINDSYRSTNVERMFTRAAIVLNNVRYVAPFRQYLDDYLSVGNAWEYVGNPKELAQIRNTSYALPDSGYYMLRTAGSQYIFDAGPKGGTHGHYDLLSFEREVGNYVPVPDPGPLRYDNSADRNYIISTPAHNTISIDGLSHEAVEGSHNPKIVVDQFVTSDLEGGDQFITAHHHAYEYLKGQPTVGRTLWTDGNNTILIDWGRSNPNYSHTFTSSLNFVPKTVNQISAGLFDAQITPSVWLQVQTLLSSGQTTTLADTFISNSPPPDEKSAAKRYAVSQTGTSALFVTLLAPYVVPKVNPATQPATIAYDATPRKGQPVKLKLTLSDGTVRHLSFTAPDLTPLP